MKCRLTSGGHGSGMLRGVYADFDGFGGVWWMDGRR